MMLLYELNPLLRQGREDSALVHKASIQEPPTAGIQPTHPNKKEKKEKKPDQWRGSEGPKAELAYFYMWFL